MNATIYHVNFGAGCLEKVERTAEVAPSITVDQDIADVLEAMLAAPAPTAAPVVRENRYMPAYCDPENEVRGSRYDTTKRLDIAEIAKLIRANLVAAKKEGKLPKQGFKTSVRIERYSGGQSLNISVKAAPFQVFNPEYLTWEIENPYESRPYWLERYTPEAKAALELLKGFMAAYNRDNSDTMSDYFDVRFYGDAGFDWELERAERDAHKAAHQS